MLRDQVFVLDHMYVSLFSTCGWILRLGVTVALLMSIHPVLALLVAFALPTVFTSTWRPGVERAVQERRLPANRLARHLFSIATTAPPGKEVRVTRIGDQLVETAARSVGALVSSRRRRALEHGALAHAGVGDFRRGLCGRGGFRVLRCLKATPGQVLLVLAAGARLSAYIGATVGEIGFLRGFWLDGSRRMAWLEDYAASLMEHADASGARAFGGRHPLRARVVCLSGNRAACARRRQSGVEARLGGRHCRREWRGQKHAGEAAVPDVSARSGAHPDRRRGSGADSRRRMAIAPRGRVSGFFPLRVSSAPHRGHRRCASAGRRTRGGRGR